jgi:hypothetical protein
MRRLIHLLGLLAVIVGCLPVAAAAAASLTVTSIADSGAGSLRAAILASNDFAVADTITITAAGTIELETALPPIGDDVTITGPGAGSLTVTRKGSAPPFSVFEIQGATATISGITVSGGVAVTGAGILNGSGDLTLIRVKVTGNEALRDGGGLAGGGGIFSNGTLTLRESIVSGNSAIARGGAENVAAGGGIETEGNLFVERSTVSENRVEALAEGGAKAEALGGGLAIASGAGATIVEESTISGNLVRAADATVVTIARGGGIGSGTLTLAGSTIAGNSAELDGAGASTSSVSGDNLAVFGASITRNSLVALPQGEGENCSDPIVSSGFNLDEDGSCGFAKGSDLVGFAAGLDPVLRDNGGPTPTHALLPGSIAIDRGSSFGATTDQRGLPRPSDFPEISDKEGGDGSDIGAFELQVPAAAGGGGPVLVSQQPADRRPPNTRIVKGPPRDSYQHKVKFRFASTEAQSTFQCKVDLKPWRGCRNPYKRTVGPGKHVFKVRAIDRFGNVDQTPARFGWRVKLLGR